MDKKDIKKLLQKEIVPYLIGLRNEISDRNKESVFNIDGEKVVIAKGEDGYTPIKDKDYPSEKTVFNFIKDNLPKKGKDYFTEKDIKDIVKDVFALMPTKEELKGEKGDDGQIDYSVVESLAQPLIENKYKQIKRYIDDVTDKTVQAIKDNQIPELTGRQIRDKLEGLSGNDRLSAKAIKGLEKFVGVIVASNAGGGGFVPTLQQVTEKGATTDRTINLPAIEFQTDYTPTGSEPVGSVYYDSEFVFKGDISADNLSGTNTGDQDLSGYVPYTGATDDLDLGNNILHISKQNFNGGGNQIFTQISLDATPQAVGDGKAIDWSWSNTDTTTARIASYGVGSSADVLDFYTSATGVLTKALTVSNAGSTFYSDVDLGSNTLIADTVKTSVIQPTSFLGSTTFKDGFGTDVITYGGGFAVVYGVFEAQGYSVGQKFLSATGYNGSATAPIYSFTDDTNTGMYRVGADSLGLATGGVNRLTLSSAGANFGTLQVMGGSYKFEKGTYDLTLQSASITSSNKTITLPNETGTVALGTGTQYRVPYWNTANTLTTNANFLYNVPSQILRLGGNASNSNSISIGFGSISSSTFAVSVGFNCSAYGQYNFIGGISNFSTGNFNTITGIFGQITGNYSSVLGGYSNVITSSDFATAVGSTSTQIRSESDYSGVFSSSYLLVNAPYVTAIGLNLPPASYGREDTFANISGSTVYGSYQGEPPRYAGYLVFGADTTDDTPTLLSMDSAVSTKNFISISDGETFSAHGYVLGVRSDSPEVSRHKVDFVVEKQGGVMSILYSNVTGELDESGVRAVAVINNTDTVDIQVTGQASASINWIAHIHFEKILTNIAGSGSGSGS